jgi:hypothetical protein
MAEGKAGAAGDTRVGLGGPADLSVMDSELSA